MEKKEKNNGNLAAVTRLIKDVTSKPAKVIAVPTELIHFIGNTQHALFLSQLIYWSDKGKRNDGYIYKTKNEWFEETGLSEYQVTSFTKAFVARELIETKLKKANGCPTVHYKLKTQNLLDLFSEFLTIRYPKNLRKETVITRDSLTENTSENTQDSTTKRELSFDNSDSPQSTSFIFEDDNILEADVIEEEIGRYDKVLIPENFSPSLDERYRAAITFPHKSPTYVTQKFVKYYSDKAAKMTIADWHDKWWDWMVNEKSSYGNYEFEDELNAIQYEVEECIWNALHELEGYVVSLSDVKDAISSKFSAKTVEGALEALQRGGYVARIEDYFYNLADYQNREEWRNLINEDLIDLGIGIPTEATVCV